MAGTPDTLAAWLEQAGIPAHRLTEQQLAVLDAAFHFRQQVGDDYYSTRLLGHFLLHCQSGLKVAAIARLLGISRPTASEQQGLSSQQVVRQAHHRMAGRPHGKLLPRYAGPIVHFLLSRPHATRQDLLDFIEATFAVRVSRIALYKFLKKYGLDCVGTAAISPTGTAIDTACPADSLAVASLLPLPNPDPGPVPVSGAGPVDLPAPVPTPVAESVVNALPLTGTATIPTSPAMPISVAAPPEATGSGRLDAESGPAVFTPGAVFTPVAVSTPGAVLLSGSAPPFCAGERSTREPSS